MATQYTPILQLALPVTGELNGTWGDVVNDNITSMVEQAIAGMATISTWTANSHTLTTANGTSDEARCAMLLLQTGAGGTALTGTGQVICPSLTKLYVVKNASAYAVTIKTAAGTGIAVAAGDTTFVFCDGTNVLACVTQITNGHITGNLTVDGNTTLGDASGDTVTINAGTTTVKTGGAIRFEDNAGGEYVALKAPAAVTTYTLTLPVDDGTNGQALITDGAGNLSWSTAAAGDVYGPASATDNAIARFDGTTGKLIQNSAVTIGDDGATVIAANSTSDGLRITQTGAGNALVVEDSANPDSTPFVIDTNGTVISGGTTSVTAATYASRLQLNAFYASQYAQWSADSSGSNAFFLKSRNATVGSHTIVQSGDVLGRYWFSGSDGTAFIQAALIEAAVDGTPGTNDMPGRLVFYTTADGASSLTERMRIDNAGRVGIGGIASNVSLLLSKSITGGTSAAGIYLNSVVQSDATAYAAYIESLAATSASAFTASQIRHFSSTQGTFGAGSTVTNQYGFIAGASLTGATNNYGFYSAIASGTGRYNFYAAGTADNYFAGSLGIGSITTADVPLLVSLVGTSANINGVRVSQTIPSTATSTAKLFQSVAATAASAFTLTNLFHYESFQSTIGAGSTVTNQYGFIAGASLTGATNNYGFYSNIAAATGRWNFYAAGTADNYFAGSVGIGTTPAYPLHIVANVEWPITVRVANSTTTTRNTVLTQKSLGTIASPTAVTTGTILGGMEMGGYNSSGFTLGYNGGAGILAYAEATWTTTSNPTFITFNTNSSGVAGYTERMRIDSAGALITGNSAYTYLANNSTTNASLTLKKAVSGADAVDYLQCRDSANNAKFVLTGAGNISQFGGQITFPATQSASSDANTLDDYEEGTWTPTITAGGTLSITYTGQNGRYVKVGSLVMLEFDVSWSGASGGSGYVKVANFPFTVTNHRGNLYLGFASNGSTAWNSGYVDSGGTSGYICYRGTGGIFETPGANLTGAGQFIGTIIYTAT